MSALKRLGLKKEDLEPSSTYSGTQTQTKDAFGFKWAQEDSYESEATRNALHTWLIEKYLQNEPKNLEKILGNERKLILDAGCGAGLSGSLLFGEYLNQHDYLGVDISDAVKVAEKQFARLNLPGDFLQCDIFDLPVEDGVFDIIFSEGVLHHTDNTCDAICSLSKKLAIGGYFMFYVYRKKAVIREWVDDFLRSELSQLSDQEAWEALRPLTKLGKALGELEVDLEVPEDIPLLGIEKGKMDLQLFFFYNICKAFYRKDYNEEEMNHVNFDWYRPLNCHRHTEEEVRQYCQRANLSIEQMTVQRSGITVVARKETPQQ